MISKTPLLSPFFVLLPFTAGAATISVPGDYPAIQAAVDAAKAGDTVKIAAGLYLENVVVAKNIYLAGDGSDKVILRNSVANGVLMTFDNVESGGVSGVAFEHSDRETGRERKWPDLLIVTDSTVEVTDCVFRKSAGCGIVVSGNSRAEITGCRSEGHVQSGMIVKGVEATAQVRRCECMDNAECGILFMEGAQGVIEENTCARNGTYGIWAYGKSPAPDVRSNTCTQNRTGICINNPDSRILSSNICNDNSDIGIQVARGCTITVEKNTCESNGGTGLIVDSIMTRATLRENIVARNKVAGIAIRWGADCTAENNRCVENGGPGIATAYWWTTATLIGNEVLDNAGDGIRIGSNSSAMTSGNVVRGNKGYGISITDQGSTAQNKDDTLEDNALGAVNESEGLPFSRQRWADRGEVGYLFVSANFDWLERIIGQLRRCKAYTPEGRWEIRAFYDGVQEGGWPIRVYKRKPYGKLLDDWQAGRPDSLTVALLRAKAQIEYAWLARGSGYADTVTDQGWKDFKERLGRARDILEPLVEAGVDDPEVYRSMLDVALGLNYDREQAEATFEKGILVDPSYLPLYQSMAFYLVPRWHGEPGDTEAFTEHVLDLTRDTMGHRFYASVALLVSSYVDPASYGGRGGFDWEKAEAGCQEWLQDYPDSAYYLNCYCLLACLFQEKERATELFGKIGDNVETAVWYNDLDQYRSFRAWAETSAPYPIEVDEDSYSVEEESGPMSKTVIVVLVVWVLASIAATVYLLKR